MPLPSLLTSFLDLDGHGRALFVAGGAVAQLAVIVVTKTPEGAVGHQDHRVRRPTSHGLDAAKQGHGRGAVGGGAVA